MRYITALDLLEETVNKYPEKTAVVCEADSVTYSAFYGEIRKLAAGLFKALKGRTGLPVILFLDKGIPCLELMYATVMSGNIYVPMDVKTPSDRVKKIVRTSGSVIAVTDSKGKDLFEAMDFQGEVFLYEDLKETEMDPDAESALSLIRENIIDTDIMYLLFTSGSTGEPKGVAVRHRSVVDYIEAFIEDTGISEEDVAGNQTPFYADMSLKDLMVLYKGGTLVIIPQKYFMTPKKLLQYLDDNNVTTIMWVPTAYRLVSQFDGLSKVTPKSLRRFVFSGESMPLPVVKYWMGFYPLRENEYIQNYGPTEITGACASHHITEKDMEKGILPIGKPYRNTGIILMDDEGNIVEKPGTSGENTEGEICVYGSCLAAGYYNDRESTDRSFVSFPGRESVKDLMYRTGDLGRYDENGDIVFISRIDSQVKHGGKRIELGEIESAAVKADGVKACCCVHLKEKDELVMLYTGDIDEKAFKAALSEYLPKYMIPVRYIVLSELPMLPNGKLDRKSMEKIAAEDGD